MSDPDSDACTEVYGRTPASVPSSSPRLTFPRALKVGLPNGHLSDLGSEIHERCLLLVYTPDICPDRLTAEVAWVDERLIPDVSFMVIGHRPTILAGLAPLLHTRAAVLQDVDGVIAASLSPTAKRTAYLVDPTDHSMLKVDASNHLFDLGREVRATDDRGNDRVLDLGDVFR